MLTLLRRENIKQPAGDSHVLPPLPVKQPLHVELLAVGILREQTRPQQSCTLSTNLLECYADSVVRNDCSIFLQQCLRGLQLACCNESLSEMCLCGQVAVKLLVIKSSLQVSLWRLRVVQRDIRN